MNNLIGKLREAHSDVFDLLLRVKALGVHTAVGQRTFMAARESLIEHLRQEDEELYPALLERSGNDPDIKDKLTEFAKELGHVTEEAMKFFDKYSGVEIVGHVEPGFFDRVLLRKNGKGNAEFAADFDRLFDMLTRRMHREEEVLFPAYSEIAPKDS